MRAVATLRKVLPQAIECKAVGLCRAACCERARRIQCESDELEGREVWDCVLNVCVHVACLFWWCKLLSINR